MAMVCGTGVSRRRRWLLALVVACVLLLTALRYTYLGFGGGGGGGGGVWGVFPTATHEPAATDPAQWYSEATRRRCRAECDKSSNSLFVADDDPAAADPESAKRILRVPAINASHWPDGITREIIDRTVTSYDAGYCHYQIIGMSLYLLNPSECSRGQWVDARVRTEKMLLDVLQRVTDDVKGKGQGHAHVLPDVEFVISFLDFGSGNGNNDIWDTRLPLFSMTGVPHSYSILVPSYAFAVLDTNMCEQYSRCAIARRYAAFNERYPFVLRQPTALWRGNTFHPMRTALVDTSRQHWLQYAGVNRKLMKGAGAGAAAHSSSRQHAATQRAMTPMVDAEFVSYAEHLFGTDRDDYRHHVTKYGPHPSQWYVAHDAWPHYRYLIDVDGYGWSGRFLFLLHTGSIVLKQLYFREFYYDHLRLIESDADWSRLNQLTSVAASDSASDLDSDSDAKQNGVSDDADAGAGPYVVPIAFGTDGRAAVTGGRMDVRGSDWSVSMLRRIRGWRHNATLARYQERAAHATYEFVRDELNYDVILQYWAKLLREYARLCRFTPQLDLAAVANGAVKHVTRASLNHRVLSSKLPY